MSCWISLYIHPESPQNQETINWLIQEMQCYTPHIAVTTTHTVILNIHASLSLFNGPRSLVKRIQHHCLTAPKQPVLAMAPTATGAQWLAWQSYSPRRRFLQQPQLNRH